MYNLHALCMVCAYVEEFQVAPYPTQSSLLHFKRMHSCTAVYDTLNASMIGHAEEACRAHILPHIGMILAGHRSCVSEAAPLVFYHTSMVTLLSVSIVLLLHCK
jgi:hypothetical protein